MSQILTKRDSLSGPLGTFPLVVRLLLKTLLPVLGLGLCVQLFLLSLSTSGDTLFFPVVEVLTLRTDTALPNCLLMTVVIVNSIASFLKRKKHHRKPQIFPHQ